MRKNNNSTFRRERREEEGTIELGGHFRRVEDVGARFLEHDHDDIVS